MGFLMKLWNNNIVKLATVTVGVLLFFKYVLPFMGPFFVALFFVLIFHPMLKKIQKKLHIPEGILAGTVLALLAVMILLAGWFLLCWGMDLIGDMKEGSGQLLHSCRSMLGTCCDFIGDKIHVDSYVLEEKITQEASRLIVNLKADFAPKALDASYSYAGGMFDLVFTIVVTIISIILLIKDYDAIKEKLEDKVIFIKIREMSRKIITLLKIYVKAQIIIVLCVSATAVAGFWVCGVGRWYLWGILAGILDMLPFIGAGIVILPVAIFAFLQGRVWQGIGCVLIYGICTFLRQILEPKLIGDKINIYPIFILLSVFFGIHFYNIGGIVLGPVSLFLIREIYEEIKES